MKQTLLWIIASVTACVICSLATYRIVHRHSYLNGQVDAFHQNSGVTSLVTLGALQKIRAGDIPGATKLMETVCFGAAEVYYHDPTNKVWNGVTTTLTPELLKYRAAYRTNSADWDVLERKLEVELASIK